MKVTFFKSAAQLRKWLTANHGAASELWVGFHKKDSGRPSITYPEALDQALCFGWIDGVRKTVDETSYTIRFSPRKPKSHWSAVNVKRFGELRALRRVKPSGLKAFEDGDRTKHGRYSYEERPRKLSRAYATKFRANPRAWRFFQAQAPSYRRTSIWWIVSAVKEETRQRRLAILIEASEKERRLTEVVGGPLDRVVTELEGRGRE